jgi:transposase-like protein
MAGTSTKPKRERRIHSARQKVQAVLAWWTERRRPSEICRELEITSNLLSQWQERAMEGMLMALEPRTRSAEDQKPALPSKVERLLERKTSPSGPQSRLERRLTALAQTKKSEKPPAAG